MSLIELVYDGKLLLNVATLDDIGIVDEDALVRVVITVVSNCSVVEGNRVDRMWVLGVIVDVVVLRTVVFTGLEGIYGYCRQGYGI